MKNKFMAFMLAAVLGVTGIAATAQAAAADTEDESTCEHHLINGIVLPPRAACYNYKYHVLIYEVKYFCVICRQNVIVEDWEYEEHDYDLIFLDNSTMISRCNVCGDIY